MEPVIKINPGATKWDIRQKVWDYIEEKNLANFPRPVHNRIPNFKGAFGACAKVSELQMFTQTAEVKVDPDKPLEGARLAVLQARKTLLVPTPRLRTGLFNKITPPEGANKEQLRVCASAQGVKDFSVPVGLDSKVKVDLVVVGSVAVSEKGFRIGKGEGFADMEYGMMASMGAVNESTVVVTVVHDCQVVDISADLMGSHDLTVDYILTPTRVIQTNCQTPKPQGIIWIKARGRSEMEARPSWERRNSDGELGSTPACRKASRDPPLQAGVGRRAALATGSCEFLGEWKMSNGETYWPPHPPTHHPRMTPDPFMCLYQTMEVRNSDESLWLCVYTPESRKEGNQPRSAKSGEVRENSCSPRARQ